MASTRLQRDNPETLASALASRAGRGKSGRWFLLGMTMLGLLSLLLIWQKPGGRGKETPSMSAMPGIAVAKAAAPVIHADCQASPAPLQHELSQIAHSFNGIVGIAVTKVGCDWVAGERTSDFFPQQSVSKLWVSLTVLDTIDNGRLRLDQPVIIRAQDLAVLNQPLRQAVLEQGAISLPVQSLMTHALSLSDNTANDRLLWTVGGPDSVRASLRRKGLDGIRFGPGERLLQSAIAGLQWQQELSIGSNFYQARAKLPLGEREAALDRYLADPMDGAMPSGIARALAKLAAGQLLSPQSTEVMMDIMARAHSGPMRLKAGAPPGWKVYHKTGTGQELGRRATGYNDVGILQAPDGARYAVAVMIRETKESIPVRMHMMQAVSAAVARFDEEVGP